MKDTITDEDLAPDKEFYICDVCLDKHELKTVRSTHPLWHEYVYFRCRYVELLYSVNGKILVD